MKKYSFCKKNGSIKKFYIPVCEYITNSQYRKHELTHCGRDEVIGVYWSYATPYKQFSCSCDKYNYIRKIKEICSNFDVETKEWVYPDLTVELHGKNVNKMIDELKKLLMEVR